MARISFSLVSVVHCSITTYLSIHSFRLGWEGGGATSAPVRPPLFCTIILCWITSPTAISVVVIIVTTGNTSAKNWKFLLDILLVLDYITHLHSTQPPSTFGRGREGRMKGRRGRARARASGIWETTGKGRIFDWRSWETLISLVFGSVVLFVVWKGRERKSLQAIPRSNLWFSIENAKHSVHRRTWRFHCCCTAWLVLPWRDLFLILYGLAARF